MFSESPQWIAAGNRPDESAVRSHYPCDFTESSSGKIEMLDHFGANCPKSASPLRSGKCSMSHCTKSASGIRLLALSRFHRLMSMPTIREDRMYLVIRPVPHPISSANFDLPSLRINLLATVDLPQWNIRSRALGSVTQS